MFYLSNVFGGTDSPLFYRVALFAGDGIMIAAFALALVLALVKENFGLKKRFFYVAVIGGVFLAETAIFFRDEAFIRYADLSFALGLLLTVPLILVPAKKPRVKEEKELIELIDGEIKKKEPEDFSEKPSESSAPACGSVNFSHVRGIIGRTGFYPLTEPEKRSVRELTALIGEAERGEVFSDTESRINDGLGELLRIMAKYGV